MRVPDWVPERWYRDIWLILITGLVALSLLAQQGVQDKLVENQRDDLCVRIGQSEQFLRTRSEQEPGLADYVRKVTLPDLRDRLNELPISSACPKT